MREKGRADIAPSSKEAFSTAFIQEMLSFAAAGGSLVRVDQVRRETLVNQGFCWFGSVYPAENLIL